MSHPLFQLLGVRYRLPDVLLLSKLSVHVLNYPRLAARNFDLGQVRSDVVACVWPAATLSATPQYVRDQEQTGSVGSELEATL
jgi:hypothetical protein